MALHKNRRIILGALDQAIDFVDCDDVIRGMHDVFLGWDLREATAQDPTPVSATVEKRGKRWHWQSHETYRPRDWDSHPPATALRVLTDVHEAALHWHLAAHPDLLCIHGAAVGFKDGLLLFPARGRSGKSTLSAHLAALGHLIFGDDVLSLRNGEGLARGLAQGLAMGFAPRLRTPLPQITSDQVRQYIKQHSGPSGDGWVYLKPDPGKLAPLGATAPINALILLRRDDGAKVKLEDARTADILRCLVAENIIRTKPLPDIFENLHELSRHLPKHWLTYSDPFEAAAFLSQEFG